MCNHQKWKGLWNFIVSQIKYWVELLHINPKYMFLSQFWVHFWTNYTPQFFGGYFFVDLYRFIKKNWYWHFEILIFHKKVRLSLGAPIGVMGVGVGVKIFFIIFHDILGHFKPSCQKVVFDETLPLSHGRCYTAVC